MTKEKQIIKQIREKAIACEKYYQSLQHAKNAMDNFVKSNWAYRLSSFVPDDEEFIRYFGEYAILYDNEHVILSVKETCLGSSPKNLFGQTVPCTKSKVNGKYFTWLVSGH
jgi:hypothetical protein